MYPSSTSSSSQGSLGPNGGNNNTNSSGLIRYGSAPSSLLATAVDSIINPTREFSSLSSHHLHMGHNPTPPPPPSSSRLFFPEVSSQLTSESACKTNHNNSSNNINHNPIEKGPNINNTGGLQRAYGFKHEGSMGSGGGGGGGGGAGMVSSSSATPLVRHSSSPAGFLNHLARACTSNDESGFSTARAHGISRLNSQLSFTRQETLSQISEESENVANGLNAENEKRKSTHSYTTGSYGGGSWEDPHTIMFSMGPTKRPKNINNEMINGLNSMESQFGMPQAMMEMTSMDKLLNIPEDSVPCKIRAKRGCATHPRSIAERERRTRISGKLKKLQDLVPNMDKQTSYSDMLDLAVQHIKGLQNQVQKLNNELENCTCGCRKPRNACGEEKS